MIGRDQEHFQEGGRLWDNMDSLANGGHSVRLLLLMERRTRYRALQAMPYTGDR